MEKLIHTPEGQLVEASDPYKTIGQKLRYRSHTRANNWCYGVVTEESLKHYKVDLLEYNKQRDPIYAKWGNNRASGWMPRNEVELVD